MTQTLLIRNIRLAGGQVTNVLIRGGYIASIGGGSADNEAEPIDGKDALLLPGLVDAYPSRQDALGHGLAQALGRAELDRQDRK